MDPISAKAAQAKSEITAPNIHTRKNNAGWGSAPAMSLAVKKMDEPMMPLTSSRTESSSERPRTRVGLLSALTSTVGVTGVRPMDYPMPSSSGASSGVPQRRQMTAPQSPQLSGSETSWEQRGQ